jgi:hypothetical protein
MSGIARSTAPVVGMDLCNLGAMAKNRCELPPAPRLAKLFQDDLALGAVDQLWVGLSGARDVSGRAGLPAT